MSKNNLPEPDPELLRLQFSIPRSWGWVLLGILIGNLNEAGPLFDMLSKMLQ
ncbi:hypothetical protein [Micromonospora sp. NPDC023814]|uniref:hypothetical protein n=1 Tax=Micromonospora sp. NPDC023814 TaxID=3154596 RepID=UPI0033FCDD5A